MSLVLAYHGCSIETAHALLGGSPFRVSENRYDWLGSGVYFWEWDCLRAYEWARDSHGENDASIVGVALELGHCLDLTTRRGAVAVQTAYQDFKVRIEELGELLPQNKERRPDNQGGGLPLRFLDRAVIDHLQDTMRAAGIQRYDTLRALFPEGEELYAGAGFWEMTHVQIAVRSLENIQGVFRLPAHQLEEAGIPAGIYRSGDTTA